MLSAAKWKRVLVILGVAFTLAGAVTALTDGVMGIEAQAQVAPTPAQPASQAHHAHTGRHCHDAATPAAGATH